MHQPIDIAVEDATSADALWCLQQYYSELNARFETGFDISLSPGTQPEAITPPHGYMLIARLAGKPVGCAMLKLMGDGVGYIKRMWVSKDVRGLGLGRKLLQELETLGRDCKLEVLQLETNK